ncbi:UBX domain-containing protein 6-like isoform X2 [Halichondria panicea]|uniref:UBX domain-containing protein 6-like isoform X2 n=1 Tax=Halichondria panicea TaxID=6063 RepID=UPI00312B3DFE
MKKFIQGKVMDYKFKKAGDGHKLTEEKAPPSLPPSQQATGRRPPSTSAQVAGQAALARLEQKDAKPRPVKSTHRDPSDSPGPSSGSGGGKTLCAQPNTPPTAQRSQEPRVEVLDVASCSVVVHMICPVCQHSVPYISLHSHLEQCLQEEYLQEPLTASVHMVHTLCQDQEVRKTCIDTLGKYLDNILSHPGEEKYTKIPCNNKSYKEKVECAQGATLFLEAIGFQQKLLPHKDAEQLFYVLPMEVAASSSHLEAHRELLTSAQPLKAKVDRNLQVFKPLSRATHFDLPKHFFNLTLEEIKKEQKQRSELAERESVLRTKVMRERDNLKMTLRHYRFALIRVRMPDGLIIQGVFRPMERVGELRTLISSALLHQDHTYSLSAIGKPLTDDMATLAAAGLVPSAMLNFSWDTSSGPPPQLLFLTSELLARVQEL